MQAGGARLLAPAVAGMVRSSLRGHTRAAAHLRDPLDEVSCSAPCRLVGSTASCAAQPVSLRTRWAHASVRARRDPSARSYAEFPHSTTSLSVHLATPRPIPRCLYPTGRNKNSLPAARWKAHVSTCNGSLGEKREKRRPAREKRDARDAMFGEAPSLRPTRTSDEHEQRHERPGCDSEAKAEMPERARSSRRGAAHCRRKGGGTPAACQGEAQQRKRCVRGEISCSGV